MISNETKLWSYVSVCAMCFKSRRTICSIFCFHYDFCVFFFCFTWKFIFTWRNSFIHSFIVGIHAYIWDLKINTQTNKRHGSHRMNAVMTINDGNLYLVMSTWSRISCLRTKDHRVRKDHKHIWTTTKKKNIPKHLKYMHRTHQTFIRSRVWYHSWFKCT